MKNIATCLLLCSAILSPVATAQWQSEVFKSGQITHHIARSHTANRYPSQNMLEIFCTSRDLHPSLGVYFANQRFGRRKPYNIELQIDQNSIIPLATLRHAMAFTTPRIPKELLAELSTGNFATVRYRDDLEKPKSIRISLRGSSNAIGKMMRTCRLNNE